jgi:hypothetical protein
MRKMMEKISKIRKDHDTPMSLIVDNSPKNNNGAHHPVEISKLINKQFKSLQKPKMYNKINNYKIFYQFPHLFSHEMQYNVDIREENLLLSVTKELESVKDDLAIVKELVSYIPKVAPNKEDENFMYEIKEVLEKLSDTNNRIGKIETTLAVIEERTKKLDSLPTKSEMQNLINEALKTKPDENKVKVLIDEAFSSKKIATETTVENQVIKSRNAIIISMITIIGLATGIIIKFI